MRQAILKHCVSETELLYYIINVVYYYYYLLAIIAISRLLNAIFVHASFVISQRHAKKTLAIDNFIDLLWLALDFHMSALS